MQVLVSLGVFLGVCLLLWGGYWVVFTRSDASYARKRRQKYEAFLIKVQNEVRKSLDTSLLKKYVSAEEFASDYGPTDTPSFLDGFVEIRLGPSFNLDLDTPSGIKKEEARIPMIVEMVTHELLHRFATRHVIRALPGDYEDWLRGWRRTGGKEVRRYDYEMPRTFVVTRKSFALPPLFGALSLDIIVPRGVEVVCPDGIGHNSLYIMEDFSMRGGHKPPVYSNTRSFEDEH